MKTILLSLFLLPALLRAGDNPIDVTSEIKEVTVFLQGAQVFRYGNATLSAGRTTLKFVGLPAGLRPESVQVGGKGAFTILSVRHQINYFESQRKEADARIQVLETQQESIQLAKRRIGLLLDALKEEEALVTVNRALGGAQTGVNVGQLKEAADFFRARLSEIKTKMIDLEVERKALDKDISKINLQLNEIRVGQNKSSGEVLVEVSAKSAVNANLTLSYVVDGASWSPAYDIRVENVSKPLELTYKAQVSQYSGEDWKNVALTISTGNPSESGIKPELEPWRLIFYQPQVYYNYSVDEFMQNESGGSYAVAATGYVVFQNGIVSGRILAEDGEALMGANILAVGTGQGAVTDMDGAFQFNLPPNCTQLQINYVGYQSALVNVVPGTCNFTLREQSMVLSEVVISTKEASKKKRKSYDRAQDDRDGETFEVPVTTFQNTTTVSFIIEEPYTILSDGKEYAVEIKIHSVPAQYKYYAVPKLDPSAFLVAGVTGWERMNLLSGPANLYFEGAYVGQSILDVSTGKDTLNISLGRDKGIVINRTKPKELVQKKWLGANKKESRAFEIAIRNQKQQTISIVIEDQLPISGTNEIKVEDTELGGAALDAPKGQLTWMFELPPSQSKTLKFGYSVKYPKDKTVVLE